VYIHIPIHPTHMRNKHSHRGHTDSHNIMYSVHKCSIAKERSVYWRKREGRGSIQPQGEDDPRSLGDHVASPGLKFTDLVVPSDVQRVTQILDTKSEHGSADAMAHVFRTHLMDSYDSKFCAEVFQVKFTLASGAKCHIVGLRRREEIGSRCVLR